VIKSSWSTERHSAINAQGFRYRISYPYSRIDNRSTLEHILIFKDKMRNSELALNLTTECPNIFVIFLMLKIYR
jgi:hypothetical protein